MTIQEILEAHKTYNAYITEEYGVGVDCKCGANLRRAGIKVGESYRAHLAEVLDKHMQEREAAAVRETARYIERLYPRKGLINRADLLADIEIAADRLGRGLHANGREKDQS